MSDLSRAVHLFTSFQSNYRTSVLNHIRRARPKAQRGYSTVQLSVDALKARISTICHEYLQHGNVVDVVNAVRELQVPHFLHELVKRIAVLGIDGGAAKLDMAKVLVEKLAGLGVLEAPVACVGLNRLLEATNDLAIDFPAAPDQVAEFILHCVQAGCAPEDFFDHLAPSVVHLIDEGGPVASVPALFSARRLSSAAPNRVSTQSLDSLKERIADIAHAFVDSGDIAEAVKAVKALESPHFMHELVKRVCIVSMDRDDVTMTNASALILALFNACLIGETAVAQGFQRLLLAADDLTLDVPHAPAFVAEFIMRAVADGCLAASFVDDLPASVTSAMHAGGPAQFAITLYRMYSSVAETGEVSTARATVQAALPVPQLKEAVKKIVYEALATGDMPEAAAAVKALHSPHFMHELVRRVCVQASEIDTELVVERGVHLIQTLVAEDAIDTQTIRLGFCRALECLDDLVLDVPDACNTVANLMAAAIRAKLLNRDFFDNLPHAMHRALNASASSRSVRHALFAVLSS